MAEKVKYFKYVKSSIYKYAINVFVQPFWKYIFHLIISKWEEIIFEVQRMVLHPPSSNIQ